MLRVAVVGSGPAGLYAAEALARQPDTTIDVLDRLALPFGLVRYGVAPDHPKIKSISSSLEQVISDPAVRFLGNVGVGTTLTLADLHRHYDAVLFAYGSAVGRRLGVPGDDLPGSFAASDFVAWYCGHPDAPIDAFTLAARGVAVVGVGNVALDVTRLLAKSDAELREVDLPDHVRRVLAASAVGDIHLIGRRGPLQAKFTTKELRELGEVTNADVLVDPAELVGGEPDDGVVPPVARRNLEVLQEWAQRPPQGRPRRIHVRFWRAPVAVEGADSVAGLRLTRTRLDPGGVLVDTGEVSTIEAQMVLASVGYRGLPLPDLPFDAERGVVPNLDGRVVRDGSVVPGEYVAGWIKRGPTGIIGTNKRDARDTVRSLLADAPTLPRAPVRDPDALLQELAERGVRVTTWPPPSKEANEDATASL